MQTGTDSDRRDIGCDDHYASGRRRVILLVASNKLDRIVTGSRQPPHTVVNPSGPPRSLSSFRN